MTGGNGKLLFLALLFTPCVLVLVAAVGLVGTAAVSVFAAAAVFIWWPVDTGSDRR